MGGYMDLELSVGLVVVWIVRHVVSKQVNMMLNVHRNHKAY